jgi:hypothetical protein
LSSGVDVEILTLKKKRWRKNKCGRVTHHFVILCFGATAVSPNVVYSDDHREHGKENGAERGQSAEERKNVLHGKEREVLEGSVGTVIIKNGIVFINFISDM